MVAMSEIKRLLARMKRELGLSRETLSTDMLNEIDRLGLSRSWFDRLVKEEGLEFAGVCLNSRSREASLFEKWYGRTKDFVERCSEKNPFPNPSTLCFRDRASLAILTEKFRTQSMYPAEDFIRQPSLPLPYTSCLAS